MKANPGGQIPASEVIGRDALIQHLWRILDRQSLILTAERRMGKTCIIKKMIDEARQEMLCIYHDLEGVQTPLEFAETLFQDVESYLSGLRRTAHRTRQLLVQLSGAEIAGIIKFPGTLATHWKDLMTKTADDLFDHQDHIVIFFWDEVPLMLDNIKKHNGEEAAMEVLNVLRSLRQTHRYLRMVFTGSIGLHNVISSLKRAGYVNDPTNDMDTVNVPPLLPADARELSRRLLQGEGIQVDDLEETAGAVATAVGGIPYFIHHVVDQMVQRGGVGSARTVVRIVEACLTDPHDRWHLRYYRERIDAYYSREERPFALSLLDTLSVAEGPMGFDELFNGVKSYLVTEDGEMVRHVLTLLQRDHYIFQQTNGGFCFRFPLIQRSWQLRRGLTK